MKQLGLLINPIAGMGGSVGLKGTDGVIDEAIRRGAERKAGRRAKVALEKLVPLRNRIEILCASGEMGEIEAKNLGFQTKVVYETPPHTSPLDTIAAARAVGNADLLLFAGGDGTARDIVSAGIEIPVIGIPAGVKIHSPVYAIRPEAAGELAVQYLDGRCKRLCETEVVDIDEAAYRDGYVSTSLYGYLQVPDNRDFLQHGKAPSPPSEHSQQLSIADEIIERMQEDVYYLVGPGSTTRTIMEELGLPNTLIGVDLICNKKLVQADLCEKDILRRLDEKLTYLILTPTGGQGYLLGRGNQQLSAAVMKRIGKEHMFILATREKLFQLSGRPLLVDTGEEEVDQMLSGYVRAIVGYQEEQMVRINKM